MDLLDEDDLQYDYAWQASDGDDAKQRGAPDNALLNSKEGYEVLRFINRIAKNFGWTAKIDGLKAEWLIQEHLPSSVRSHKKVETWLFDNWNAYDKEWKNKVARGDLA